jgi:hypothetical protein
MADDPPTPDVVYTGDKLEEYDKASQTRYIATAHDVVLGQGLAGGNYIECPSGDDLVLFADRVTIMGRCDAPGRKITIFARLISAESVDKAKEREKPAIIVDGTEGAEPPVLVKPGKRPTAEMGRPGQKGGTGASGEDGNKGTGGKAQDGAAGGNAGQIRIFCQRARPPFNLELSARGGAGGKGQDGQNGGDGGDGGPGYSQRSRFDSPATGGGDAGAPGKPGARGEGGQGGKGGTIIFHTVSRDPADGLPSIPTEFSGPDPITEAVAAGEDGPPGEDGEWGEPGEPGEGGCNMIQDFDEYGNPLGDPRPAPAGARWTGTRDPLRPPAFPELENDSKFRETVEDLKQRKEFYMWENLFGAVERIYPVSWMVTAREYSRKAWQELLRFGLTRTQTQVFQVLAGARSLLTRAMNEKQGSADVKRGAGLDFYLKHEKLKPDFGRLTSYLRMQRDRARFLFIEAGTGTREDPDRRDLDDDEKARQLSIKEAKNRIDWANAIIDARTANNETEANALTPLARSLGEMEESVQQGRNAFGKEHSWTPNVRFNVYKKRLSSAIAHLKDAETKVKDYRTQLLQLRINDARRATLAEAAASAIEEYKTERVHARNIIFEAKSEIERGEAPIIAARNKLLGAYKAWSEEAKRNANWGGLALEKLLDVVFQIGFIPEAPLKTGMSLAKSASLLGASAAKGALGSLNPTITGDDGQPVQLNYALNQVNAMASSIEDDLAVAVSQLPSGDLKTTDTRILLTTKATLKKLLNRFYNTSNEAHNAAGAMNALIDAVDARNGAILKMNAALAAYRQAEAQMNSATKLVKSASQKRAADNLIGLHELVDLVDGYHNEAKERCLRNLYCLSRAYYLWELPEEYTFFDEFKISGAWDFDSIVADRILGKEIDKWEKAIDAGWSETGVPTPVKKTENLKQNGITIVVSEKPADGVLERPEVFRWLRDKRAADVTLPPSTRYAPVAPFNNMCHVRLRVARCWLMGATSTNGLVRLELTHSGTETFVTPDNRAVEVTHDPLRIHFWYWADKEGKLEALATRPGKGQAQGQPKDGNLNDPDHSPTYAAIGPFAKWTIKVLDDEKTVNLSNVQNIVFEFFVYYRPLP